MHFQNCAFFQHKTYNFACYAFNGIRSRIVRFTRIRSLQEPPGRPPGGPGPRPDGPKRRPEGGKKKLKSVQEGPMTRQEGKLGGPKRAPRRAKMDPRGKCKYFFTPGVKKYCVQFLAHFCPLPRRCFFTFFSKILNITSIRIGFLFLYA